MEAGARRCVPTTAPRHAALCPGGVWHSGVHHDTHHTVYVPLLHSLLAHSLHLLCSTVLKGQDFLAFISLFVGISHIFFCKVGYVASFF